MKRVTLFTGHYGSGKTNIAVNYALALSKEGHKTLIADLDIVNPYFRTRDSEDALKEADVDIVVSSYANTNVDVPALPEEMYRIIDDKETRAVVDVGGDDRGALALGRLAPELMKENDYEMVFVMNFFRPLTQTPDQIIRVIREVEIASGMTVTALINNSNLGQQTESADIIKTDALSRAVCEKTNLPLIGTTVREDLCEGLKDKVFNPMPIRLHFRDEWAIY